MSLIVAATFTVLVFIINLSSECEHAEQNVHFPLLDTTSTPSASLSDWCWLLSWHGNSSL